MLWAQPLPAPRMALPMRSASGMSISRSRVSRAAGPISLMVHCLGSVIVVVLKVKRVAYRTRVAGAVVIAGEAARAVLGAGAGAGVIHGHHSPSAGTGWL